MMMIKTTVSLAIALVLSVVVSASTSATTHHGVRGGGGGGGGTVVRNRQLRQDPVSILTLPVDQDPPIGTTGTTTTGDEEDPPPIGTTTTTTTTTLVLGGDPTTNKEEEEEEDSTPPILVPIISALSTNTNTSSITTTTNGDEQVITLPDGTSTIGGDEVPGPLLDLADGTTTTPTTVAPTRNANAGSSSSSGGNTLLVNTTDDEYTIWQGYELRTDASSNDELFADNRRSILLNDTSAAGTLFVRVVYESGDFEGNLQVFSDGDVRYEPSDNTFLGTETFIYTACLTSFPGECKNGTVRIRVIRDPNRPTTPPRVSNKDYEVNEGETLRVDDPGFLDNDFSGTPSNPLRVCEINDDNDSDSYEGRFDIDEDGSFEYRAPRCFTNTETFSYKACYEDFRDIESGNAFVNVRVREHPDRPPRPQANDDSYNVLEGETLDVHEYDGLLQNDNGERLYVRSRDKKSGFVGNLEVDKNGGFRYESRSGQGGLPKTYEFTYEICVEDWEDWDDCVGCSEATVRIEVRNNPNKPQTAPVSRSSTNRVDITPGERLRSTVINDVEFDPQYTLEVTNYQKDVGFRGILNTDSDGSFEYGNSPVGDESTFTYTICYQEWPDVCSAGSVTISTGYTDSLGRQTFPSLEEVGNNGDPEELFPLQECQADCDEDEECAGDLICMIRDGREVVPGCTSDGIEDFDDRDFCIQPSNTTLKVVGNDGDPAALYPLGECEADCDSDLECRDDLICFERDDMENVPGCDGDKDDYDGRDFCVAGAVALNRNGGRGRRHGRFLK